MENFIKDLGEFTREIKQMAQETEGFWFEVVCGILCVPLSLALVVGIMVI